MFGNHGSHRRQSAMFSNHRNHRVSENSLPFGMGVLSMKIN